ncbi:MAG: carbamoyltransferase HypF, partial [bacterium]
MDISAPIVAENRLSLLRLVIHGAVQGVGFRPFVYRLAAELRLTGWICNTSQGVFIEVEGESDPLNSFLRRLDREKPPHATIHSIETSFLMPMGFSTFEIRKSDGSSEKRAVVLPDIATCPDCLKEVFDPSNRRYRYPFTNCTNCGPRYSIIEALPYDRPHTTMRRFAMCLECRAEYENPSDRRFHAQPNACPVCGPHLELWGCGGEVLSTRDEAILGAARAVREGRIVALKGLGGFHLMADARSEAVVERLRRRKRREEKPLALMFPDVESLKVICDVSPLEERLLLSAACPIVLLRKKKDLAPTTIAPSVAPQNPYLGAMLPYTPLHHLLMREIGFPVVATSGNLSDEPICTDEREALERLAGIADLFLVHNRPIARHVDDSVTRIMAGRELVLRRARGYAPLPILAKTQHAPILAVGAHLKNAIAVSVDRQIFVSQHIGDLETVEASDAFEAVIKSFERLYELKPVAIACDAHPNYLSTQYANRVGLPVIRVQHHYAHILSCMAENELDPPALGIAWDGTGFGADRTVWGGEFLEITSDSFRRFAHFRTFRLPGGDKAVQEPRRVALGLLFEIFGPELFNMIHLAPVAAFSSAEVSHLRLMLEKGINSPITSSAGRLFDAVASILGVRQKIRFEGQAAMELEFLIGDAPTQGSYPFEIREERGIQGEPKLILDWVKPILRIINDIQSNEPTSIISSRFHNTLIEMAAAVAVRSGHQNIVLSGGCFQN